jgi:hypothetical protein
VDWDSLVVAIGLLLIYILVVSFNAYFHVVYYCNVIYFSIGCLLLILVKEYYFAISVLWFLRIYRYLYMLFIFNKVFIFRRSLIHTGKLTYIYEENNNASLLNIVVSFSLIQQTFYGINDQLMLIKTYTIIMNLGPTHPSTHGVLRVLLLVEGEYLK